MLSSNKECEWDPDHLYHDHREADELRANVELLTRNRDAARMIIGPLSERPDLVDACEDVVREADELRAENELLRAELARWKPANCGKIRPVPVPGEAVEYCIRGVDHDGPHEAKTGRLWVLKRTL
jgi:hypothetical protein